MNSPFEQVMITGEVEQLEEVDLSLLETLDHVLNRGLVIAGEITIAVADIDLIFVGLNVLVSSVETANEVLRERQRSQEEGRATLKTESERQRGIR
jgi:gas vesicle structural protein